MENTMLGVHIICCVGVIALPIQVALIWGLESNSGQAYGLLRSLIKMYCPYSRCSFCQVAGEDVMHALWTCPKLVPAWVPNDLARKLARRPHLSLLEVLSDLFVLGNEDSIAEFAFMLWLLWNRRKKALDQNELKPLKLYSLTGFMLSTKFLNAQWKPSSHYSFKINFDAALFRSQ
jgi:hypothetical protein